MIVLTPWGTEGNTMSHYHMVGALITAYHSNEDRCGPGEHTRHDAGRLRYEREMVEMWQHIRAPWTLRRAKPRLHSAFRNRRHGRAA